VGILGLLILVLITINTALTKPHGLTGIPSGQQVPPFAVPLAQGNLKGAADVATRPNEGAAGRVPACKLRGSQILNVCQLYEQGPVVLALFIGTGSCARVLGDMQGLVASFPGVRFAALAIKGDRTQLRRFLRSRAVTFPVGVDEDGRLAQRYSFATCPQVTFAYPGGVVQSKALLVRPSLASLRARVNELAQAARARGWRPRTR
jgi:hypothetical protein